ncbi:MAG: TetR/AcrR family transcriptional regulator [Anaerolineae bacterium]|nr:TetR/AcrR family transcriptional regulator [Anaerolineae bacterium]
MPKQTFFNLADEKRTIIVNTAIDEFAEYGFEAASINRIVANSGIAKGSFYQYFEDKLDVFRFLIDLLAQEKTAFFKDKRPPGTNMDTFQYYRWMIKTGMEFNSTNPRLVQAISRVLLTEGMFYGKDFETYRQQSTRGLMAMIQQAIERGEIDPSIDVDLAIMIMETWNNAISSYFLNEGMKQKDIMKWVRSAKTQEKIDKLLYVMEYGLRKTESEYTSTS